jgi:hypothetical protein
MNVRKIRAESIFLADRLYRLSNEAAKWAKKIDSDPTDPTKYHHLFALYIS